MDVPARTAVALARVVVVGVIAVGIGIVIVIGVVIDIIVSSSRRSLSRSFVRSALFRWRPIRSIGDGIPGGFSMISWSKLESRTVRVIHPSQTETRKTNRPVGEGDYWGLSRTDAVRFAVIGDDGDTTSMPLCSGF